MYQGIKFLQTMTFFFLILEKYFEKEGYRDTRGHNDTRECFIAILHATREFRSQRLKAFINIFVSFFIL